MVPIPVGFNVCLCLLEAPLVVELLPESAEDISELHLAISFLSLKSESDETMQFVEECTHSPFP